MRQCPHRATVYKLAQLLYQISSRGDVVNVGLYNVHHGIVTYRIISVNTHRKRTDYVDNYVDISTDYHDLKHRLAGCQFLTIQQSKHATVFING